jgi:hypothetical protein
MAAIEPGSGGGSRADEVADGTSVASATTALASSTRTGLRISDLPGREERDSSQRMRVSAVLA